MRTALFVLALAGCMDVDVHSFSETTTTVTGGSPLATETDTVTVVAAVGEDNGDNTDLSGATLKDAEGNTYAGFVAAATGGTFTATLTFEQINQVAPITFDAPGGTRTFVAAFFDDYDDTATREFTLELACRGSDGQLTGACNGVCQSGPTDSQTCVR